MIFAGRLTLLALASLMAAVLIAVILRADWPWRFAATDWQVLRFTLLQAVLSATVSVACAVPLARALARRRFVGRGALVLLLGVPFLLPVIVAVFGIITVWGRSGWVSDILALAGAGPLDIYGLTGVVLAHVFFNLPLATRLVLFGWAGIPLSQHRLADGLGLSPWRRFVVLEVPMLREVLPGAFLLIFILCVTSFAVVLTLGGGPRATSMEVAIFSAIRFEFDLGRAAVLALVQLGICLGAAALLMRMGRPAEAGADLMRASWRGGPEGLWLDRFVIAIGAVFLLAPLLGVVLRGLPGLAEMPREIWAALWMSVTIAAASAVIAVAGALVMAQAVLAGGGRMGEVVAALPLIISPFVLGTGLFLMINPVADPFALAWPVTAGVNAALSLPFVLRLMLPALARVRRDYGPLCDSLGLVGWARVRRVTWPGIRAPLGFATGLALALSMGDLGVIALFAPVDGATLPLLMYRLMGAYRLDAAAGVALVLVAVSFAGFALLERGGRLGARL